MEESALFEMVQDWYLEPGADFFAEGAGLGPSLTVKRGDIVMATGVTVPYIDAEDPDTTKEWYQVYHPQWGLGWIVSNHMQKLSKLPVQS
jgi:hypothetical protein